MKAMSIPQYEMRVCPVCGKASAWEWMPITHWLENGVKVFHAKFMNEGRARVSLLRSWMVEGKRVVKVEGLET